MATWQELDQLKWQRPFRPFRVTTFERDVIEVRDPRLMLVDECVLNIGIPDPYRPPPFAKSIEWIPIAGIVSIELCDE